MTERIRASAWIVLTAGIACVLIGCNRHPTRPLEPDAILQKDEQRLLMAQVVDDSFVPDECAVLEGRPYKHLLKNCAAVTESRLKDREIKNEKTGPTYERLQRQPNLFRGQVVVIRRCVVIEVDKVELPTEFGLPGYSVMPALLVNQLHELYELRILQPPGSDLCERLQRGIEEGKNPVLRVSGYFLKNHSKLTNVKSEPPWRVPLLVCPEPSIENRAGTYNAYQDLVDARMDRYLPSQAIDAPRAEERMVVEVLPAPPKAGFPADTYVLRALGKYGTLNDPKFLGDALERFKTRLPADQRLQPSVVVLRGRDAPVVGVRPTLTTLNDLGLKRIYVKDENEELLPDPVKPDDKKEKKPKEDNEDEGR